MKKTIIIIFFLSLFCASIAGGLAGFYSANYINGENTPFLFSLLYQKFVGANDQLVEDEKEFDDQLIEDKINEEIERQVTNFISIEDKTISAVKKTSPSVVSVVVSKYVPKYYYSHEDFPSNDFFDDFFDSPFFEFKNFGSPNNGPSIPTPVPNLEKPDDNKKERPKQQVGGGTGFVVSNKKGLILTNKHVVSDKDADYSIINNNGDEFSAKVLARDPFNDIAILKIEDESFDLPDVKIGNSDDLKIGQSVIAIGNALGEYRNTVTRGVVSGIGRRVVAGGGILGQSETLEDVIQTDAAINSGNSGGPLINLKGEVVGINTAISRQGQLIGFSIPINQAKNVIESILTHGKIVRPFLGVRYTLINKNIVDKNNLEVDHGALIIRGSNEGELAIIPGSPADKASLVENDIILKVNDNEINNKNPLSKLIQKHAPGDKIILLIYHKGEQKEIEVILEEYTDKKTE